jgi:hypothetical protein
MHDVSRDCFVFSGHANVIFVRTESNLETAKSFCIQTSPETGLQVELKFELFYRKQFSTF